MSAFVPAMTKKGLAMTDIRVPTLGESVTEATVGKWFKQPGEAVAWQSGAAPLPASWSG